MKAFLEKKIREIALHDSATLDVKPKDVNKYPRVLYKYRDCDKECNFQIIENSYLWAAKYTDFDDQLDAIVNLKLKNEFSKLVKCFYEHLGAIFYYAIPPKGMRPNKHNITLNNIVEIQSMFIDSDGKYNAKKTKRLLDNEIKKTNNVTRSKCLELLDYFETPEFELKICDEAEKLVTNIKNSLRDKYFFCCLTERNDNTYMWESYADNYSGFAIEYNLLRCKDNSKCREVLSRIFPVKYHKKIPAVALLPFFENVLIKELYNKDTCIEKSLVRLFKQMIAKNEKYSKEEEWRIVSSTNRIEFPVISAIYAGHKITRSNLDRLKQICKEKNIPLYQQRLTLGNEILYDLIEE